jgi:hypothetical protein
MKEQTTKALKTEIEKLTQAYQTIGAENSAPAEMIPAITLVLATYRKTKRDLTRELRQMTRTVVRLTALGKATDEHRELVALCRENVIELTAKIAALEASLYLWREWSKVKPA